MRFSLAIWILNFCIMMECYLINESHRTRSPYLKKTLPRQEPQLMQQLLRKEGECPPPTTLFGPCIFNSTYNCRNDAACRGEMKCCREGCNKVCKMPLDESNPFIWEWFDEHADQVAKFMEVSEDWVKKSFDDFWEIIVQTADAD